MRNDKGGQAPALSEDLEGVDWKARPGLPCAAPDAVAVAADDASHVVDVACLLEAADDDAELLEAIIETYLENTARQLEALRAAIDAGDCGGVECLAHKCLGGSVTCGMNAVVAPLRELERMGKAGQTPTAAAHTLLDEAMRGFKRIEAFLETLEQRAG